MTERKIKNIAASIRSRLLNHARETNQNYNALMNRFFQERFLTRLSQSLYKNHFVLKGGLLLLSEYVSKFRPTIDIDMLGVNIDRSPEKITSVIEEISAMELDDGVLFNCDDMSISVLKKDDEYEGLRCTISAQLGKLKSRTQIDIAFGDAVPFKFKKKSIPTILDDFDSPELLIYPMESVIAEKFQAIVYLGEANSRMKDFYDIIFIAEINRFKAGKLKKALQSTFDRRRTNPENRFFIYQPAYIKLKSNLWKTFSRKIHAEHNPGFPEIIIKLHNFIEPLFSGNEMESVWEPEKWEWANH